MPFDICVRIDKHSPSVYGPSVTPIESTLSFCCVLLACHEGRGRSPSVSEISERTDLPTFQDIAINLLSNNANKTN